MTAPVRICFVCLGNICRSPTAQGVMEKLVADAGLADVIAIDSAGTGSYHVGELPDPRTREAARRRGLDLAHRAWQFQRADLARFELVIALDRHNLRHLQALTERAGAGGATPSLHLLRSFDPSSTQGDLDVPDPWAGGDAGFEEVLDQCERACAGLLAHLRERLR